MNVLVLKEQFSCIANDRKKEYLKVLESIFLISLLCIHFYTKFS